jgi:hypothetical protein
MINNTDLHSGNHTTHWDFIQRSRLTGSGQVDEERTIATLQQAAQLLNMSPNTDR